MDSLPGFRFGMVQPAVHLHLVFALPEALSIDRLDQWIIDALESDITRYQPLFMAQDNVDSDVQSYIVRLLYVTTILLQDIRVPLFERPVILSIAAKSGAAHQYIADLWFPVVAGFPVKVFHEWLGITNELLTRVCAHLRDPEALEAVYQDFQKRHVLPWSQKMAKGRSTIPILQAAFELGIPFAHCGSGRYVLGWGNRSRLFDRSSSSLDAAIGAQTTHNKPVALQMMRFAGIPVPKGLVLSAAAEIRLEQLTALKLPLVVKPTDKDRGIGVSLGITDNARLQQATATAAKFGRTLLIEEQVPGTCHRILVVGEQVLFVIKRNPRSITGDGRQTVEALVQQMNHTLRKKIPQKRLPGLALDEAALECLFAIGLTPQSIPGIGEKIALRPAQSAQWGGDPQIETAALHPDNAEIAIRAARLFGLACAGVDFISTDIRVPWHQNGAVINEVNYAPVIGRTHEYQRLAAKAYLRHIFPTQGKIAIDVYIGQTLKQTALDQWRQHNDAGQSFFMYRDQSIYDPDGRCLHFALASTPPDQVAMLRTDRRVGGIIVHLDTIQPLLEQGAPFEYATSVRVGPEIEADSAQREAMPLLNHLLNVYRAGHEDA